MRISSLQHCSMPSVMRTLEVIHSDNSSRALHTRSASSSAKRDWSRFVHKTAADVYDALSTRRFEQAQLQQAFGFEAFKFVTALTVVLATDKIDAQT